MEKISDKIFKRKPSNLVGIDKHTLNFTNKRVKTIHFPLDSIYLSNHSLYRFVRKIAGPLIPLINYKNTFSVYFVDGFIKRTVNKFIKRYVKPGDLILEVGVGGGKLIDCINFEQNRYLGFDICDPTPIRIQKNANLFVASVEDIPVKDNTVNVLISTEVFEHVSDFSKAKKEIYRVCKPGAKLIVTIPNNFCYKYTIKGKHPDHINKWHYNEFIKILSPKFELTEGQMMGYWLPILRNSNYSIQFPFSHDKEFYNTNFFYVFECVK